MQLNVAKVQVGSGSAYGFGSGENFPAPDPDPTRKVRILLRIGNPAAGNHLFIFMFVDATYVQSGEGGGEGCEAAPAAAEGHGCRG